MLSSLVSSSNLANSYKYARKIVSMFGKVKTTFDIWYIYQEYFRYFTYVPIFQNPVT